MHREWRTQSFVIDSVVVPVEFVVMLNVPLDAEALVSVWSILMERFCPLAVPLTVQVFPVFVPVTEMSALLSTNLTVPVTVCVGAAVDDEVC
jgi:hypothetical protein